MIPALNIPKIGNYITDFVPDSAPLGKMTKKAADEAHEFVSDSMLVGKKVLANPKSENTVEEMVGKILNFFG